MITIRPFQPDDLDAVYTISLATGFAGGDASHLYTDPKMMGHIYSAPYVLLEPGLALIAEDEYGTAGFIVGTVDTISWEKRLEQEWWPSLRKQYTKPAGIEKDNWTADERRVFMIHHPAFTPVVLAGQYPAHLHMNLLPRIQKRGVGSQLFNTWLTIATERGAEAMHIGANKANEGAVLFWKKQGFEELLLHDQSGGRTVWMGRPAKKPSQVMQQKL